MKKLKGLIIALMILFILPLSSCQKQIQLQYSFTVGSGKVTISGIMGCEETGPLDSLFTWKLPNSYTDVSGNQYKITEIGSRVFAGCTGLGKIELPDTLERIGYEAFKDCVGMTKIVIPESVTYIGSDAFAGCTDLTIYCRAAAQPSGWSSTWNSSECPVVWGAE